MHRKVRLKVNNYMSHQLIGIDIEIFCRYQNGITSKIKFYNFTRKLKNVNYINM